MRRGAHGVAGVVPADAAGTVRKLVATMITAGEIEHLVFIGGIWLALVLVWAAACIWIDADAGNVFGGRRGRRWTMAALAVGVVLFLATFRNGFATFVFPLFIGMVPLGLSTYVVLRDKRVTADDRIFSKAFVRKAALAVAEKAGCADEVERWFSASPTKRMVAKDAVQFVKKDGKPVEDKFDRETSKALNAAKDIFGKAIRLRATDIHLEPKTGEALAVRCRIDGMMQNIATVEGLAGRALVSAVKVLADMDIAERRRPQDGTFAVLAEGKKFDVRAASGPTSFGEKMALRLLDAGGDLVKGGLKSLGMSKTMLAQLESIIHQPHGMLIVCGPTGSGKTTTLYTALGEIDVFSRNIVTIEDPIEYRLDNISQTAVNNAAELTFAKILRSVLRQDPDVILVGEVRDRETAEIAMQAALTGHFVFTTLHANDTATTVTRLLDIGIEISLIQSAVTAVLAQRLVRVLCPKCKEAYPAPDEFRKKMGVPPDKELTIYREKGCAACLNTGFRGRTGVHELLVFNDEIKDLLVGHPSIQALRAAGRRNGMRTLQEAGLTKVLQGVTSIAEVGRMTK